MKEDIINRHLAWSRMGYGISDIFAVRNEIKYERRLYVGSRLLQKAIGGEVPSKAPGRSELEELTYLYLEEVDFDGDLTFLEQFPNLECLHISGNASADKVSDLRPLTKLGKLKFLSLPFHHIENLEPLRALQNLESLDLEGNRQVSIAPLKGLVCLKNLQLPEVSEAEVFDFQRLNPLAKVCFTSAEDSFTYDSVWIRNWGFKSAYFKDKNSVIVTTDPMLELKVNEEDLIPYNHLILKRSEEIANRVLHANQVLQVMEIRRAGTGIHCKYEYANIENELTLQTG